MPITTHRPLPAELKAIQDEMEEIAAGYGLDFFETIFEMLDYEELSMFAAYGGFPGALSALAIRSRVRRIDEELLVRSVEDLRDGHQHRPVLRLPAECERDHRPEAGDRPRLRALRLLQEQRLVLEDQSQDARPDGQPRRPRSTATSTATATRRSSSSSTPACRSTT